METIENVLTGTVVTLVVIVSLFGVWGTLKLIIRLDQKRLIKLGLCPHCGQKEDGAKLWGGHAKGCQDAIPF